MQTKTVEQTNKGYVKKSLQAYLEGEKNLAWIAGVIGSGRMDVETVRQMLMSLPVNYITTERYRDLAVWLDSQST